MSDPAEDAKEMRRLKDAVQLQQKLVAELRKRGLWNSTPESRREFWRESGKLMDMNAKIHYYRLKGITPARKGTV